MIKILLIEDDQVDRLAFDRFVLKESLPYKYVCAGSVAEAKNALKTENFDVVIMDFMLGDGTAFDLFGDVPVEIPVIVVTGEGDEEIAVQLMKAGAFDYITKHSAGRHLAILPITVRNAVKAKQSEKALREAHEELERRVELRTAQLKRANEKLLLEIRERKRAEEKYRSIFENAVEGIFQSTPDGRFISANPALARIYGYDCPEELLERVTDIGGQLHANPLRREQLVNLLQQNEQVRGFEAEIIRKDGRKIWVSIDARPILDEQGNLEFIEGLLGDITDRTLVLQALRESEERYRTLVENIDIGVTLLDHQYTIVTINQARARMVGKSPHDLIGRKCFEALRKAVKICPDCPCLTALKTGRTVESDTAIETPDGSHMNVRIRVIPIFRRDDSARGFVALTENITERLRFEAQLHQAAKMEAIGRLAGGMAHDFNNFLTTILGYSHLLLQQIPHESPHHHKVAQIYHSAQRSAGLTRQLLAFSRKQVLELRPLDINAVVADLEPMLRRLIGEDVGLSVILDPCLGTVMADPGQIEQILMNLAVNSRDAMPEGGRLTLETGNVFLDADFARSHADVIPGKYVMFAVSDTGIGMESHVLSQIFEPFFTTKEEGKGTGLGLPMVYGIVKQHKGHIFVYSEPKQGTTVKIYWQAARESAEPLTETPLPRTELRGSETILVVEDEEIVRELTCEILHMLGYEVLKATDPGEAIEICATRKGPIQMLLTDVVMPHMNGTALFNRLAVMRPGMEVLYMSGYTENFIVHHGVPDPAVHFLQKPFTGEDLAAKVRFLLDQKKAHPE
jgi:two-component system, cell cycle sensor histidine kinase and response regulator CckA